MHVSTTNEFELAGKVTTNTRVKRQWNLASQFGIYVGAVDNILKRKRECETVLIWLAYMSGTCVHEHISPLLGEHPCIVNISLALATVHYREFSLYLNLTLII